MLGFEIGDLILIAGIFVIAGVIKGAVGIGLPTASVGLMSQVLEPRLAISLVLFPSLLSNAWQIWRLGGFLLTFKRFWLFLAALTSVILLVSMTVATTIRTDGLILVLGCVIVLFSVMSLAWAPPFMAARWDKAGQVFFGGLSGAMGGLTAIWAPAMVPYLMARRVDPTTFMQATGVIIFIGTIPLIIGYVQNGFVSQAIATVSMAMTAPAIAGFQIGEQLRKRLDADRFRTAVLVIFLVMGLNLIRRAVLSD